jgi:maleate isomerase
MSVAALREDTAIERARCDQVRRVGFVIPSSNRRFEPEAHAFLPASIVPHIARARMTGPFHGTAAELMPRIIEAAESLSDARCELIFIHCTAFSMELGPEGELATIAALQTATSIATATTGVAVLAAMRALQSTKVAVATPYDQFMTDAEVAYMTASGLSITTSEAFALKGSDAFCSTSCHFWCDALEGLRPRFSDSDSIFLSCANIRCLEDMDAIERAAARPVVTSNQAALWYAARTLGASEPLAGMGCLSTLSLGEMT